MVQQVKVDLIEVGSFRQEEREPPVYDVTVVLHVTSDFGRHEFRIPVRDASTLDNAVLLKIGEFKRLFPEIYRPALCSPERPRTNRVPGC